MNISPINVNVESRVRQNRTQPNFGLLRRSHSPEMKVAKKIFKKNGIDFYDNLVNSLEKILGKTAFFDGLLDIKDGQFVLRMMHKNNFVWPGELTDLVYAKKDHCYISRGSRETEFHPDYDRSLRLTKIKEDKYKTIYSVKNMGKPDWKWSDKASVEQAKLIKELDDTILDMATEGSVYLGHEKENAEYFPYALSNRKYVIIPKIF